MRHGSHRAIKHLLVFELLGPLLIFYGMRAAGVDQVLALIVAALLPCARAVYTLSTERRVSGVTVFVLGAMILTVAMSFIAGSSRVLLIRDAWGMAAMGLWMLITLLARRPFLYEAAQLVFSENQREAWAANWEGSTEFRHVLRVCTGIWGVAFLVDTGFRVMMAAWWPIDLVPILENVLLVITVLALIAFQTVYGRAYLRRRGLRIQGAELVRTERSE